MIVFVTGRDDCIFKGFEAHAVDYMIKPCQPWRLRIAVEKVRQHIPYR